MAGKIDKGAIFSGPLSWTMQNDVLSFVFAAQTKTHSVKISEDGEYLYLEGSAPYLFQRTSYPQNSNCLYPW